MIIREWVNRNIAVNFFSMCLILMAEQSSAQGDLGYRFIHSTIGARDFAPNYAAVYSSAAADFMAATNLSFYWSSNQTLLPPFSGDVAFSEINYGATGWDGTATPYNAAGQPCADPIYGLTGYCTMANGADFGWVKFNTFYPNPFDSLRNRLFRHELGHILGLSHSSCPPATGVMSPGTGSSCQPFFQTLQPGEAAILGSWY